MKKKNKEYIALTWCKEICALARTLFGEDVTAADIQSMFQTFGNEKKRNALILKNQRKISLFLKSLNPMILKHEGEEAAILDKFHDIDCMVTCLNWERNKQVFKFDKDFIDELLRTENVIALKNVFDYLPYKSFYMDISNHAELCKALECQGIFVYIEKIPTKTDKFDELDILNTFRLFLSITTSKLQNTEEAWVIHICRVDDELFYNDTFILPNMEHSYSDDDYFGSTEETVPVYEGIGNIKSDKVINGKIYEKIIIQFLLYLSSAEPDIKDDEITKETYRKPSPASKPKNKFSEIKSWKVGVRVGSAFRKWAESESKKSDTSAESKKGIGAGTSKRPHPRRAHYGYFWYGKKDGVSKREKRAKWLDEIYVNKDKNNGADLPAVIHKVK